MSSKSKCSLIMFLSQISNSAYSAICFENYDMNSVVLERIYNTLISAVVFANCNFINFPNKLLENFPNIQLLKIENSFFSSLKRSDFVNLKNLKEIHITGCKNFHTLTNDVFEDLKKLEFVILSNNFLLNIGPNIFDPIPNLKFVNLNDNPGISGIYNAVNGNGSFATFKELKSELIIKNQHLQILALQQANKELEKKKQEEENNAEKEMDYEEEVEEEDQATADIMKTIKEKKFRDFSVFIDDNEILVHRIVLASRCEKFARILSDENVRHLSLLNITTRVFGIILDYLYFDKMPIKSVDDDDEESWKYLDIFEAAVEFELEKLKEFAIEKIIKSELSKENAVEILDLSNKHDNEKLRSAAFNEIQKLFQDRELNQELAKDTEKVKKLIETLKKKEKMLKEAEEKFEKELKEFS